MENVIKVSTIEELVEASSGEILELPPFSENTKFFARIRRPSLLSIVKGGRIPNELLTSANELFVDGIGKAASANKMDANMMKELLDVMEAVCEESFVEPKYSEIKKANIELTDEQIMFVFNYAQSGVRALDSFRSVR